MSREPASKLSGCPMSSSLISTCSSHKRFAQQGNTSISGVSADELEPLNTLNHLRLSSNHSPLGIPRPPPQIGARSMNNSLRRQKKERLSTSLDSAALRQNKNQNDCVGKCVLCLFINAIFIFAIFLAFLIGHWASSSLTDGLFGGSNNTTNTTNDTPTTKKAAPPSRYNLLSNNFNAAKAANNSAAAGTNANTNYDFKNINNNSSSSTSALNTDEILEILTKQKQRQTAKIPTIYEIYPPTLDDDPYQQTPFSSAQLQQIVHRSSQRASTTTSYGNFPTAATPNQPLVPLPKNVLPTHYDLQLDFTEFSTEEHIRGNVSITLQSFGNSTDDELIFHASSNIFIHRIRLRESGQIISVKSVKRHFQRDLVRVILNDRLKPTWYKMDIEFRTKICQSDQEGVHCVKHTILDKKNSTLSTKIVGFTTKFEPIFARTFLPCWDEPRIKTTFNVSVRHPYNSNLLKENADTNAVLSNTIIAEVLEEDLRSRTVRYALTPKMPVYLLAFAMGPWRPLELRTNRNLPLTIWVDPDEVVAVHFTANFSPVMFDRVEEEFGVKYPLSKMDFVVVPNYPVGGMENFGLIVFHSNTVLLNMPPSGSDEENNMAVDRISEQYKIQKVVTHEIVHQWFGNLVSISDWENLWLSEGFTSYFVFDLLNEEHPSLTEYEYYMRLIELLNKQTTTSPYALVHPLNTAQQINDMFDSVHLYTKGAVTVKMLKDLVGAFDFRAAITKFLKKYSFGSVDRHSLWSSLPTYAEHGAEQERLEDIFQSWLLNEGLPEVLVSRNYVDQSIRVTQRPSNQNRYAIYLSDEEEVVQSGVNKDGKVAKRTGDQKKQKPQRAARVQRQNMGDEKSIEDVLNSVESRAYMTWDNFTVTSASSTEGSSKDCPSCAFPNPFITASQPTASHTFNNSLFTTTTNSAKTINRRKGSRRRPANDRPRVPKQHHRSHHRYTEAGRDSAQESKKSKEWSKEDPTKIPLFSRHISVKRPSSKLNDQSTQIWLSPDKEDEEDDSSRSRQSRAEPDKKKNAPTWWIPFSYSFGSARSPKGQTIRQFWLKNDSIRFVDVGLTAGQYFLANPHWVYPYKVNYDMDNWRLLIKQLHTNYLDVPVMSRMQLLVDSETYLKQSGVPHHYVHLLNYLSKETELSVLLTGLDAIHSLVDMFSGTSLVGPLLVNFVPVIQLDRMLDSTMSDPELAALWLLSPLRLAKLYQLRCLANLPTCAENQQVTKWLAQPTGLDAEHHQQITAICHFLFTQAGPSEISLLMGLLRQKSTQWSITIQLATCVRDETLIKSAVDQIIKTRNAAVFASALKSGYSIQYNRKFRETFWKGIANLSLNERQLLFAVNSGQSDRIARVLIHSVRTPDELNLVEALLIQWPENLRVNFKYLKRKLNWIHGKAREQIHRFLVKDI